jgi:hypothetical protein
LLSFLGICLFLFIRCLCNDLVFGGFHHLFELHLGVDLSQLILNFLDFLEEIFGLFFLPLFLFCLYFFLILNCQLEKLFEILL